MIVLLANSTYFCTGSGTALCLHFQNLLRGVCGGLGWVGVGQLLNWKTERKAGGIFPASTVTSGLYGGMFVSSEKTYVQSDVSLENPYNLCLGHLTDSKTASSNVAVGLNKGTQVPTSVPVLLVFKHWI